MDQSLLVQLGGLALGELFHSSPGHAGQIATAIADVATARHTGTGTQQDTAAAVLETAIGVAAKAFPQNQVLAKAAAFAGVVEGSPATIAEYDQGDAVVFPLTPTLRGHQALILIMRRDGRSAETWYGGGSSQ